MPLTFGAPIGVHPHADPLDDVRWADEHPEFDGAWAIDHLQGWAPRGVPTEAMPDPHHLVDTLSVLAAGAALTRRVPLGVAVTDPVRRSGVALAHTASTISWIGGRPVRLGLGVGDPGQLQPFGLHPGLERTGRLDHARPALRTIDRLRTGPAEDGGADLPLAAEHGYELFVAAHGPRMLDLTGRHADGWLPTSIPPADYRTKLDRVRRAAGEAGRAPDAVRPALFLWSALGTTERESARLLRDPSVRAVALYRGPDAFARHGAPFPLDHGYVPHLVDPARARDVLTAVPDALVGDAVLHGSPESVREQLDRYHRAGCEHVIVYDVGRFVDREGTERFRRALLEIARM